MLGLDINQAAVGEITDWEHCTYASCAMRAVQAVKMARAGFQAPSDIYTGAAGVDHFFPHADTVFEAAPDLARIIFERWPALVFCQTPTTERRGRDRPKGDPDDLRSDDDLTAKLEDYFFFARDAGERTDVIARLWDLENQSGLDWLNEPLKRRQI